MLQPFDRLAGVLRGAWPVLATLLGLHFALWLVFGHAPRRLAQAELVEPKGQLEVIVRMAQVERLLRQGGLGSDGLAVMIGFSTAREGVDPSLFAQATEGRLKLLNLAGSGGSFFELQEYFEAALTGRPRPNLLIVALHPCWLAGRVLRTDGPGLAQIGQRMRDANPGQAVLAAHSGLWDTYWVTANRTGINYEAYRHMYAWRAAVAGGFSLPPTQWALGRLSDPWRTQLLYEGARAPAWALDGQMRYWHDSGWFDAGHYSSDSQEARALQSLLGRARAAADRTLVVLMPESKALRERVPEVAALHVGALVRSVGSDIEVLDLRDAVPEEHFYDHAHLNEAGRRAFSELIGARLASMPGS